MADRRDDAMQAGVVSAALAQGRRLDAWSLGLTLLALAVLLWQRDAGSWRTGLLAACVAAGLGQRIFAVRTAFDAILFRQLAAGTMDALDAALAACGLRANDGKTRQLDSRCRGALKLLRWQAGLTAVQFMAIFAAAMGMGA